MNDLKVETLKNVIIIIIILLLLLLLLVVVVVVVVVALVLVLLLLLLLLLLQATRGVRSPNLQVVITHASCSYVCSQHSFGLPLRMYGMQRTHSDHARLDVRSRVF